MGVSRDLGSVFSSSPEGVTAMTEPLLTLTFTVSTRNKDSLTLTPPLLLKPPYPCRNATGSPKGSPLTSIPVDTQDVVL